MKDEPIKMIQFSSVSQLCPLLSTPWTAACQASLSISNSWSLFKLVSIESVMSSPSSPEATWRNRNQTGLPSPTDMGLNPHSAFLSPVTGTHWSRVQRNPGNSNPGIQQIPWSQKFLQPCPSRGSSCWWLTFFFLKYVLKWLIKYIYNPEQSNKKYQSSKSCMPTNKQKKKISLNDTSPSEGASQVAQW